MPCGLIINELVSNALKHAFPNGRVGRIEVELRRANDNQVVLYVRDNGIGFPTTSKDRQNSSLGLQLVSTLVQQLDGAFERQCHQGTEFCIRFFSKEHITITHQDEVMTIPQG
jgi:two-component sensor histidine kinase